jgi:hypothetical protein
MSLETDLFLTGTNVTLETLTQEDVYIPKGKTLTITGGIIATNVIIYGTLITINDSSVDITNVTCYGGTIQLSGLVTLSSCILTDGSSAIFSGKNTCVSADNTIVDKQSNLTVQSGVSFNVLSSLKLSNDSEIIYSGNIMCYTVEQKDPFATFLWWSTIISGYFVWRNRKTIFVLS